jgi:hypothetical protein
MSVIIIISTVVIIIVIIIISTVVIIIVIIISIIIITVIIIIIIIITVIIISALASGQRISSPLLPPHISLCSGGPHFVVTPRVGGLGCFALVYLRQRGSAYT